MTQQNPYRFTSVRQSMSDIQNLIRMQEDMKASRIAQNVSDEIEQEQQTVKPERPITETVDVEADPGTLSRAFDAFGKVMGLSGDHSVLREHLVIMKKVNSHQVIRNQCLRGLVGSFLWVRFSLLSTMLLVNV